MSRPVTHGGPPGLDGAEAPAPLISVVVPVYKEERNIRPFLERIEPVLASIGSYEILFCLDPSPDRTDEVILAEARRNPRIARLAFSRRFGQPAATMAGILNCRGETCLVIDVDLQDPPELIPTMYAKSREGFDVVYAQRKSRRGETPPKIFVAWLGYKVIDAISDVRIPRNTGDFRIMSRRVIEKLRDMPERHGFLRGLVAFVGFDQAAIEYDRDERAHGPGNYNRFFGSMKIGLNGVIGFSTYPLSLMLWSGLGIALLAVLGVIFMVVSKVLLGNDYPVGIPTLTILVLFLGGVQLASVGLLGEYIGRIYEEVRQRPRYIVQDAVNCRGPDVPAPPNRQHPDEVVDAAAASSDLRLPAAQPGPGGASR